jgi:hypothetical protein
MQFKQQSLDFLRAKVYTYDVKVLGMSNEKAVADANARCAEYEAEFAKVIDKYFEEQYFEIQKSSLTSPFTNVYSKLLDLNNRYNIDPIDFHQFEDVLLPQVKERFLKNASVGEKAELTRKFNFLESQAKSKILGKHLDSFKLNRFLADALNEDEISNDKDLELVSIQVAKMVTNKTLIVNEVPEIDFPGLLAPYSADGKTGYESKEGKNVLSPDDLNKLFLAKRDLLGDSTLLTPDDTSVDEANDNIGGDVRQDYAPLNTYTPTAEGMPKFAKNEIIPGYTLHAKITNLDYESDSNLAKVGFQIGVSKTDDVNQDIV